MHSSNRQAARKRGRNGNRFALLISAVGLSLVSVSAANAQGEAVGQLQSILDEAAPVIKTIDVLLSVLFIGLLAAAFVTAILGMRQRSKIAAENSALRHALSDKTTQANRLAAVVSADGQATLIWTVDDTKPQLFGQLSAKAAAPSKSASFLAFGRWIEPKSAVQLERSIAELRENARSFSGVFETISGQPLEVTGRTSGGAAIVYMRELSEERARYYRFQSEHEAVVERLSIFEKLLNAVPSPAWLREPDGSLTWANTAYLNAMGTHDLVSASRLSDDPFRVSRNDRSNQALVRDGVLNDETTTVVAGDRRVFRTTVVSTEGNLIGLAEDHTSEDSVRRELSKTISLHEETLDGLNTAVAMFDENKRLRFYNQAFAELWDLPPVFLEKLPDMSLLLNQLRTEGKLPEMPEWQRWKNNILDRFQAVAPDQDWWHLPDGRMIRVMAHPHPKGGMTWVFENFTERRDLESRFAILTRVQSETLDHLAEGVAVFSPNGNLELHNPAFSEFWGLRKLLERERVHITAIQNSWNEHDAEYDLWSELTGLVTGFDEQRGTQNGRFEFADQTLTWSALPLPNSQTMITFMDTTGVEQIERALRDKNEALERTAMLRARLIRHVAYELRSPLTNIVGFADLLRMEMTGPLSDRQSDYVGNISHASSRLMEVTDDVLDLATIDAGMLVLEVSEIEIGALVREAADDVRSRFENHDIELLVRVDPNIETMYGDRDRLRKVFVNLLKNAAAFAPQGSTVPCTIKRFDASDTRPSGVVISVRDDGPGIDQDIVDQLFERFETAPGGRNRGTGLGLPIARSFVELHEGEIAINSRAGAGTTVEIYLPQVPSAASVAAQ